MKSINKLFKITARAFFISIIYSSAILASDFSQSDLNAFFNGSNNPSALVNAIEQTKTVLQFSDEIQKSEITKSTVSNDFIHFWEKMKEDVFDDVCKAAQIRLSKDAQIENIAGIDGKFKRYLKQFPDNHIALIDEVGVKLTGAYVSDIIDINNIPFNISMNGHLEGKSVVVRKLEGVKYCRELDTLIDLRKVKTILPINPKRLSNISVGEIWKFPLTLRIGLGGSIGTNFNVLSVSFSLGTSKEKKPSITLYRMDENTLRFRIRFDSARVTSGGVSAGAEFSAGLVGLPEGENIFTKFLEKTIAKEFNKYLAFRFGLSHSRTKGKKILIEFLLNPNDPEQMEKLSEFLKGDLGILRKFIQMGIKFNDFSQEDSAEQGLQQISEIANKTEENLGADISFAGTNHYQRNNTGFNFQVPFIHRHEWSSGIGYNRYQSLDGKEVLHSHQTSKNSEGKSFNIPFIGTMVKHNTQQNTFVVNYEKNSKEVSDPVILYQRYEGFTRESEGSAKKLVENVNDILKYAGTKGEGTNSQYTIPTAPLFPKLAEQENITPEYDENGNQINTPNERYYRSAVIAFNLVFGKKAVQDILTSPVNIILKSYFNILDSTTRSMMKKIEHLFTARENGKVDYDYGKVRDILEKEYWYMFNSDYKNNPMEIVQEIAYTATSLIRDVIEAATQTDWRKQAKKISEILAGRARTNLGYEDILKIFIQLINPKDIYANFTMHTNKKIKGEEDISVNNHLFSQDIQNSFNSQYADATALRDRFSDPSTLTD